MKTMMLLPLLALLNGCMGHYFNDRQLASLRTGMTAAEVKRIMGSPTSRTVRSDGAEVWVWAYGTAIGYGRGASVVFQKGVAVAVPPVIP